MEFLPVVEAVLAVRAWPALPPRQFPLARGGEQVRFSFRALLPLGASVRIIRRCVVHDHDVPSDGWPRELGERVCRFWVAKYPLVVSSLSERTAVSLSHPFPRFAGRAPFAPPHVSVLPPVVDLLKCLACGIGLKIVPPPIQDRPELLDHRLGLVSDSRRPFSL